MKPRYAGCAQHAMLYYARHNNSAQGINLRSAAEVSDWLACKHALRDMDDEAKKVLLEVYGRRGQFGGNVHAVAEELCMPQQSVWVIINRFELRYASLRGLI